MDANGITHFVGQHLHENLFFGVATRYDASGGSLENCQGLPALFVDLDFKLVPEATARKRLYECPFPPSAAILSGHGLHVYWFLREALPLHDEGARAFACSLLRRLAYFLGADLAAAEPARVLRVPGTFNYKYDPARRVRLDHLAEEIQYNAQEVDDLLPPEPIGSAPGPFTVPEQIHDGARNTILYKLGRALKAKGLSREAIRAALLEENRVKCAPALGEREVDDLAAHVWTQSDRPPFASTCPTEARPADAPPDAASEDAPDRLGVGLGTFLAQDFSPLHILIEGLLSDDGGGWISGEEKLGKSYYAVEEALCLALAVPVCGRFAVPVRGKVLFIEEEDSPRRAHRRVKQLLRGHGLDPDDPALRAELDQWFRISVWTGFTLDEAPQIAQLRATLDAFRPAVVYLDVLRKLTTKELNKGGPAGEFLKVLDDFRREFGVLFRVLAHNRKVQGAYRAGRGSQEIAGNHALGAWAENSLFFEPIGKKHGAIKIEVQRKDGATVPAFGLRFEAEGPADDPTLIRLHAEDLSKASAADELKERVFGALGGNLPRDEAVNGLPGVSIATLAAAVTRSHAPVRTAVSALVDEGRCVLVGLASKQKKLYAVKS
jgi:hypothetical protein